MTVAKVLDRHIEVTPEVAGGKPRIANHRITVQNVVIWHDRMGLSADEIASEYDLTLADIYAALTYYYDHRLEIDGDIRADEDFIEELRKSPLQSCWRGCVASSITFYMDEHVHSAVTAGLCTRGVDVLTAQEARMAGAPDVDHLALANREERVLFTQDADFLRLNATGIKHSGITSIHPSTRRLGALFRVLCWCTKSWNPQTW